MRYILIVLLGLLLVGPTVNASTVKWGSADSDYTLNSHYTIEANDTVIVLGNFFDTNNTKIIVNEKAVLIVHGNMTLENTQSDLKGDIIVLGDVSLKNTDMISTANLVIGGVFSSAGGNLNAVTGDVYLLDPEANPNPPTVGNPPLPPLDLGDLIENGEDSGLIEDILEISGTKSYVWDGSESGTWSDGENWTGSSVPGAIDSAVVSNEGVLPLCPIVLTLKDLTIESEVDWLISEGSQITILGDVTIKPDAKFTIPSNSKILIYGNLVLEARSTFTLESSNSTDNAKGSQVTIEGNVTVADDADLFVNNSHVNPTSFIVYGAVTGDITFEWTYNNTNWWFIGHPISNAKLNGTYSLLGASGINYVLYDLLDGAYTKLSDDLDFNFSLENPIKGYIFKVLSTPTLTMKGKVNNAPDYSKPLEAGWQIIANPYPSYYQIPTESADPAVANPDFANTTGSIYVTNSTSDSDKVFFVYNTLLGVGSMPDDGNVYDIDGLSNGIIAPGQAFYVKKATDGTITMRAENRIHDVAKSSLKSGKATEEDVLRIKLRNANSTSDEAVIALREQGDVAFTRMDSEQRFQANSLSYVYSVVEENKVVINALPMVQEGYAQALGVQAKAGHHTFYIEGIESLSIDYELVLEDKLTGVQTPMINSQSVYEFTTEAGTFDDRFVLHFKAKKVEVPTDIDGVNEANSHVNIYMREQNSLTINCDWDIKQKTVEVYSVSGSLVMMKQFDGETYEYQLDVVPGIYIVKIVGGNHSYQEKVFVK